MNSGGINKYSAFNCFLTLKHERQKGRGVSMLCNGNQLFLQQSPTSQCMHTSDNPHSRALRCLQIRLSSQHSQASNLELACGGGGQITLLFSVSIDRLDYRSVGHHSQSSQFLLQIPKFDYCSGSLSALYLIYNILPSPPLIQPPLSSPRCLSISNTEVPPQYYVI